VPVNELPFGAEQIVAQKGPLVEKLMELKVQRVTEPRTGVTICDLGQNMVGWAKLKVNGAAGQRVVLRFGEMLNPDGTLYTANLRGAKATDKYTLKGGGTEVFEPPSLFTVSGTSKSLAIRASSMLTTYSAKWWALNSPNRNVCLQQRHGEQAAAQHCLGHARQLS